MFYHLKYFHGFSENRAEEIVANLNDIVVEETKNDEEEDKTVAREGGDSTKINDKEAESEDEKGEKTFDCQVSLCLRVYCCYYYSLIFIILFKFYITV